MSTSNPWEGLWTKGQAWAAEQSWHGWASLPPGPEREQKHAAFVEWYERTQAQNDELVRVVTNEERERRGAEIRHQQMRRYGIPERVWAAVLAPEDRPATAAISRWLDGGGWFLCLSGGVGTGKTTASSLALLAEGGYMVTATQTADHLFDRPWWDGLDAQPLVVLDDLGTEKRDGEGYWLARWWALVDARYREKRKLIVTCNMPQDVFRSTYCDGDGGRTLDRLRDGGTFSRAGGESMRFGVSE